MFTFKDIEEKIKNKELLQKALTLASNGKPACYEQLEFLGDRVLGLCIADLICKKYPKEKEGKWAIRFTNLVCESTLAEVARELQIANELITNENVLRENNSILADVCEAIIAVVYLELGFEVVKKLISQIWAPILKREIVSTQDPKSRLQEWTQKHFNEIPVYEVINQKGPDHAPNFEVKVTIPQNSSCVGEGSSKKEAMKQAAIKMLEACEKQNPKGNRKNG